MSDGSGVLRVFLYLSLSVPALPASSHSPHTCPPDVADLPGALVLQHIEQRDLIAGVLEPRAVFVSGGGFAESRFNECDGQGRPATDGGGAKRAAGAPNMIRTSGPEATSCFGCHARPRPGGAGDFVANTFNGAELLDPVTDSVSPTLSNERNTTGMFGASYIELLALEMTGELRRQAASVATADGWHVLTAKGVEFPVRVEGGRVVEAEGIDTDLIVKPFGAGGTKVSIREFTVGALNRHHGMQPEEAYDLYLGDPDYDEDGVVRELTVGDVTVLSMWQAMLDRPQQELPDDAALLEPIERGEQRFVEIGCAGCHTPSMVLNNRRFCEPNRYNPPGTFRDESQRYCIILDYNDNDKTKTDSDTEHAPHFLTPLTLRTFTDLKRHTLCDRPEEPDAIRVLCNEQLAEGRPDQGGIPGAEFFLTADLWQVGESAPYGHDGRFNSLSSIILAHAGEGRASRDAYAALPAEDQMAIIKFLQSLKILNQLLRVNDG